jgi:hypothetical protein
MSLLDRYIIAYNQVIENILKDISMLDEDINELDDNHLAIDYRNNLEKQYDDYVLKHRIILENPNAKITNELMENFINNC